MNTKESSEGKKQHEKSALYPAVTISDAIEFIKQIDSLGGKSVSYSSILGLMGLSSPTTRSFMARISASKQFGYITTGSSTVQLTEIAKRILYPTDEYEKSKLIMESFSNPPLYEKLIERFINKAVPPKVQLANIMMNEYRIVKAVKDQAAECFINSAENLGLIINGVLCYGELKDGENKVELTQTNVLPVNNSIQQMNEVVPEPTSKKEGYSFEIPTLSGNSSKIYIPADVSIKDLDFISVYVKEMLPKFIENLKEEINNELEV